MECDKENSDVKNYEDKYDKKSWDQQVDTRKTAAGDDTIFFHGAS